MNNSNDFLRLRKFNINDVDLIRKEEQRHEAKLKKELFKLGIFYKSENYRPFGIKN